MKTCSFVRKWLLKRFPPKQYSVAWKMPPCKSQPPGRISPQAPFKAWKIQRLLVVYSVGPKPVDILPDPRMSTPCRTRLLPGQTVPVSPHTRRLDAPLPGSLDAREHSPLNWSRYFLIIFWIKSLTSHTSSTAFIFRLAVSCICWGVSLLASMLAIHLHISDQSKLFLASIHSINLWRFIFKISWKFKFNKTD